MKYRINIDQLIKVWQNQELEVEFDGTESELVKYIQDKKGDLAELNPEYLATENVIETEESLDEFEIQDIEKVQE